MLLDMPLIILGLIIGSFITALSYRLPRKISNIKGRSFCDNCRKEIKWYDNIPLVSYLLLGGKCRNCKRKISPRYPLIELITAMGFVLIGVNIIYLALFCLFELIFIIDLEHQIIPDELVFLLLVLLSAAGYLLYANLFAGFVSATFLMFIHLITKGRGMGLGDVKLAVAGGMLVGLKLVPVWFFVSFAVGAMVGILLLAEKKAGLKSKIAFGPFLIIGIAASVVWGDKFMTLMFR